MRKKLCLCSSTREEPPKGSYFAALFDGSVSGFFFRLACGIKFTKQQMLCSKIPPWATLFVHNVILVIDTYFRGDESHTKAGKLMAGPRMEKRETTTALFQDVGSRRRKKKGRRRGINGRED